MFVRESQATICLLSQPEALMISSGSAVNNTLTRTDSGVLPPSFVPCYLFPILHLSAEVVLPCTQTVNSNQNIKNCIALKNSSCLLR